MQGTSCAGDKQCREHAVQGTNSAGEILNYAHIASDIGVMLSAEISSLISLSKYVDT